MAHTFGAVYRLIGTRSLMQVSLFMIGTDRLCSTKHSANRRQWVPAPNPI